MLDRHPLHMRFVDHGSIPRRSWKPVPFPGERVVDDDALRDTAGAVVGIGLEIFLRAANLVGEERVAPLDPASDRLGVRVDEQLRGIEAMSLLGPVRTVDAIAVVLPRANVREIAVPDLIGLFVNL